MIIQNNINLKDKDYEKDFIFSDGCGCIGWLLTE